MLEYLRNMSGKPVAKILIGILMFSFVGWGVAEWIFSGAGREPTLVKIGSDDITVQQYNNERSREMSALSRDQQKEIYTNPGAANAFNTKVLSDMTNNIIVENHAKNLGFIVTDKRIAREISNFPEFQQDGKFSTSLFDFYMQNMNYTETEFADFLRGQIMRSLVLGPLAFPPVVPEFAIRAAYNARYGERQIDYVELKYNSYNVGEPSTDQLREFYAKNPKMNPETRSVSYVLIPAKISQPDSYDIGYANAQKLEDLIISGESMSSAAAKAKGKYVHIPAFEQGKAPIDPFLTDQMVARIFATDQGLESEIIETKDGFIIFIVEKINPSHVAEFDKVKKDLISAWKKEEQKKQAYLAANELLISANKGDSIKGKKTAVVSRASGAPTEVLVSAFSSKVGSNALVPGQNAFYVVHVEKEIIPKDDTAKMAALRKELQNIMTRDMMEDYSSYLYREYPVKINTKNMNKFFGK